MHQDNLKKLRSNDFLVVSLPRSGNTWLRLLLSNVILQIHGIQTATVLPIDVDRIIPDINAHAIEDIDPRIRLPFRLVKSHRVYEPMPCNCVYLFRKTEDALCSYYHYHLRYGHLQNGAANGIDDFCLRYLDEGLNHIEFFVRLARRAQPEILFLSYEALMSDPVLCLKKTLAFVGLAVKDDICRKAVADHTFEKMRRCEEIDGEVGTTYHEFFFRKGKIGSASEELHPSTLDHIRKRADPVYRQALSLMPEAIAGAEPADRMRPSIQRRALDDMANQKMTLEELILPEVKSLAPNPVDALAAGQTAQAMAALVQQLAVEPDNAAVHNALAVLSYNAGDKQEALRHHEAAARLAPWQGVYQKNLADFYHVELGRSAEAIRLYMDLLRAEPNDTEVLLNLGHISAALDHPEEARVFFQRVLTLVADNAEARKALADLDRACLCGGAADPAQAPDPRPQAFDPRPDPQEANRPSASSPWPLVTAIVSTYNAERFISGCLDDLESQTIADQIEIIVVDSASPQNEGAVVAALARGKYITNANTDDRHRPDAFEIMARTLECLPLVALVYADALITETPNETFARNTPVGWFRFLDWDRQKLLEGNCFMGPQPMWRADLHKEYGFFDGDMVTSGDYEFWLRISQTHAFWHIPEVLGLYLKRPDSIEHANRAVQVRENQEILAMYRQARDQGQTIRRLDSAPAAKGRRPAVTVIVAADSRPHLTDCLQRIERFATMDHDLVVAAGVAGGLQDTAWDRAGRGRCRLVVSDQGWVAAVNQALAQTNGQVVLLLHDKVQVTAGWMEGLIDCLRDDPQAGLVATAVASRTEDLDEQAAAFKDRYRGRRISCRRVAGDVLALRRELIEKVGLPDPALAGRPQVIDDWCLRARLKGLAVIAAADILVGLSGNGADSGDAAAFAAKWSGIEADSATGAALLRLNALDMAEKACHQGDRVQAVAKLVEGIGRFPEDKELYHRLALVLIGERRFDQALQSLHEMSGWQDDLGAAELIGACLEGLGRLEEAGAMADTVLESRPDSARALNLKGVLAAGRGQADQALAFFARAAQADPHWGEPHANRATVLWNQDRPEEALAAYERGFVLNPADLDVATLYHGAIAHGGAFARAKPLVAEALEWYPDNRKLAYMMIDIDLNLGDHPAAMARIQKAVAAFGLDDGILAPALRVRGLLGPLDLAAAGGSRPTVSLCLICKNDEKHLARCLASALPVADEIIVVDTGSSDRTAQIAEVFGAKVFDFAWTNDFAEARNQYLDRADGDWILVLDADEALSSLDYENIRCTTAHPPATAYNVVTRNYTANVTTIGWKPNQGQYPAEEAGNGWVPTWKVRLFPNDRRIRYHFPVHEMVEPSLKQLAIPIVNWEVPVHHYGNLDREKVDGKHQTYYDLGIRKLAETGDEPLALREMAIQAGVLERFEEAIDLWRRFLTLMPDVTEAYINLSTAHFGLGRYEQAYQAALRARALSPLMPEVVYNLAVVQVHRGRVAEAIGLLEELVERAPDYQPARFVLTAAYYCADHLEKAAASLKILIRTPLGQVLAVSFYTFAKTLLAAGRRGFALKVLEAAQANGFVNGEVLEMLARCRAAVPANASKPEKAEQLAAA